MLIADRYETLELLGTGGMGDVYLAKDLRSGQQVAVKLLKEEVTEDIVVRFDRECEVLARMSHPAVVRVLDRGESEGRVFYAMDHIPWPTLSQRISTRFREGKGFALEEVAKVLRLLAGALDHLHSLDVVHRDLKPSNLLVSDDFDVRVIDFGLAGMLTDRMTRTGALLGSMLYLSPEQLRADKSLDKRSDVFQVGLILYEMLTGRKAYTDVIAYVKKVRGGQPPFTPPAEVRSEVSRAVSDVVMRALAIPPEERPASAGELLQLLETALASPDPLPQPAPARPSRPVRAASASRPVRPLAPEAARPVHAPLAASASPASRAAPSSLNAGAPPLHPLAPSGGSPVAGSRRPATALVAAAVALAALAAMVYHYSSSVELPRDVQVTPGFFRSEVRWSTDDPGSGAVRLSRSGEADRELPASGERSHVVTFVDLEAGASYRVQLLDGGRPAGPPVILDAPAQPSVDALQAEPSPDGTVLVFRTPVACTCSARWSAASGETGESQAESGPSEVHRLALTGFRPKAPFQVELHCTSRLGELWSPPRATVERR